MKSVLASEAAFGERFTYRLHCSWFGITLSLGPTRKPPKRTTKETMMRFRETWEEGIGRLGLRRIWFKVTWVGVQGYVHGTGLRVACNVGLL